MTREDKESIRKRIRAKGRQRDPQWVQSHSASIQAALMTSAEFIQATAVGCYLAVPTEVQTDHIVARCWQIGQQLCVPAFHRDAGRYDLTWLTRDTEIRLGAKGIPEPVTCDWTSIVNVDLMIVPGVAFDRHGGRVGHGAGHIDRLLSSGRPGAPFTVGLAFDFQLLDHIPMGRQDVHLDMIISEGGQKWT